MANDHSETVYPPETVAVRLSTDLDNWTFAHGFIRRTVKTTGWKATMMVVNAVAHLCEAAWHHPDLEVSYNRVTIRLKSHDVDAITDRDFELAAKIEQIIGWAPAGQTGALTGPPKSQRILADPA